MNTKWSKKWTKILVWASGYLSFIAYALVGGYILVKSQDEELKRSAKQALIVTLIFTAASAFLTIFSNIGSIFDSYYSSVAYDIYNYLSKIVSIAKIALYAFAIVKLLLMPEQPQQEQATPQEETNAE